MRVCKYVRACTCARGVGVACVVGGARGLRVYETERGIVRKGRKKKKREVWREGEEKVGACAYEDVHAYQNHPAYQRERDNQFVPRLRHPKIVQDHLVLEQRFRQEHVYCAPHFPANKFKSVSVSFSIYISWSSRHVSSRRPWFAYLLRRFPTNP